MTKVVYNACFGGFSLSYEAVMAYAKRKGIEMYAFVDGRDKSGKLSLKDQVPYAPGESAFCIHYRTSNDPHGKDNYFSYRDIERDDPDLVAVVEDLGEKADGSCARLKIADIPEGTQYRIDEYDGSESVDTRDSYDWKTA